MFQERRLLWMLACQPCGAADVPQAILKIAGGEGGPLSSNHNIFRRAFIAIYASIASMATLTIRRLDEKTKARLRVRAAHHGRSMEEEAREILRSALRSSLSVRGNLAHAIHQRFARFAGLELDLPKRDAVRQAPQFSNDHS